MHFLLVFDDEEENKLSYTEIHQQYKQLVSNGTALTVMLYFVFTFILTE